MIGDSDDIDALRRQVQDLAQRVTVIEGQQTSLKREIREQGELLDTIASPPWKRLLFFLQGYRLWKVGRWYGKTNDLK